MDARTDAATGADAGVDPYTGTMTVVGVGAWGLRVAGPEGASWSVCGNPSTGADHTPDLLRNVGYGDGAFVAVGGDANAMVMRSVDGVHWEQDLHPVTNCDNEPYPASCKNWMGAVAYGDGVWLAGGGNGALMRSTDGGFTWTGLHPQASLHAIRAVAYGNGRFVIAGDLGMVALSDDAGDTWDVQTLWNDRLLVTYGAGVVIAWGAVWNGSSFDRACFVSTEDGDGFQPCAAAVAQSDSFVHDGARWIAPVPGGYASSDDAVVWTTHTVADFPGDLLFEGTRFYGRRGNEAFTATALDDWQLIASDVDGVRAWTVGRVRDVNLPVVNVAACQDNR